MLGIILQAQLMLYQLIHRLWLIKPCWWLCQYLEDTFDVGGLHTWIWVCIGSDKEKKQTKHFYLSWTCVTVATLNLIIILRRRKTQRTEELPFRGIGSPLQNSLRAGLPIGLLGLIHLEAFRTELERLFGGKNNLWGCKKLHLIWLSFVDVTKKFQLKTAWAELKTTVYFWNVWIINVTKSYKFEMIKSNVWEILSIMPNCYA